MSVSYRIVKDDESLRKLCLFLSKKNVLAMDLEMENNLHRYGTHLALIQISDGKLTWLVDPLGIKNFSCFIRLMENPKMQKIFHDPDFDLRILDEKLSCYPKNLFDTKIAAELCGKKEIGLGPLLQDLFNVKKDLKCQKFDWLRRPLTPRMREYAAKDVIYLIKLRDVLTKDLAEKNRVEWLKEENKLLENIRFTKLENPHLIRGSKLMTGRERAILHKLYNEREKIAKKYNKPSFHIFGNRTLLEFAENPPKTIRSITETKGISWIAKKHAKEILEAAKNGKLAPVEEKPPKTGNRKPPMSQMKFDYLKEERNKIGEVLEIEPHLIMSVRQIDDLARGIDKKEILKKWQLKVLNAHGVKI